MADAPKLLGTDTLRQAYPKFNQAIDNANEALGTANTAKSTADNAKGTAETALANSENTQTQLDTIVVNGDSSVEAAQARVDDEGNTFTTLKERLDSSQRKLTQTSRQIKPYSYIDYGIAFRSDDTDLTIYDQHASWAHGNVAYDETDDKVVVFYDLKATHALTGNRVLLRKKDVEGSFGLPIVVANKISQNISCKTQASGIAKNGDYISLVAHFDNATGNVLGTFIYRSTDKGTTWTNTEMKIGGNSVIAANGDVTGFLVLKSGRILSLIRNGTDNKIAYSDDNGVTWNYAATSGFNDNTEPAWCELSDGTIICYLRKAVDNVYDVKTPAFFTKSIDGGLSWSVPVPSTTILDFTNSNGHLLFHEDTKTVEFIHHSRFQQPDTYSSLYVSVANEEDAKKDVMGEQIRISRLSPHGKTVNGSTGDSGYVGACKSKTGVIHAFYYNGTYANAQICYLVGYKSLPNRRFNTVDPNTGIVFNFVNFVNGLVPTTSEYYEQGGINLGVGSTDTLISSDTRIRSKDFVKVQPSTKYSLVTNLPEYNVVVREYDSNFVNISDSGWKTNYIFTTSPTTAYMKVIIKKADGSKIKPADVKPNLFEIKQLIGTKLFVYDNGNEKEFDSGLFKTVLIAHNGLGTKNANNLQLAYTATTNPASAMYITNNALSVTGYTKMKCKVIVSDLTGSAGASIRLYTKNNPAAGDDGRVGVAEIKTNGHHTLELAIPNGYTTLYPAIAATRTADSVSSSITAKFFEIWFE